MDPILANRSPRRTLIVAAARGLRVWDRDGPGGFDARSLGEVLDSGIGQQTSDSEQAMEDHILRRHSLIFPPDHIKRRGDLAEF